MQKVGAEGAEWSIEGPAEEEKGDRTAAEDDIGEPMGPCDQSGQAEENAV